MKEGLSTIACDPALSDHLPRPLNRDVTPIEDSFRPYFDRWTHGVGYRCTGDGTVRM